MAAERDKEDADANMAAAVERVAKAEERGCSHAIAGIIGAAGKGQTGPAGQHLRGDDEQYADEKKCRHGTAGGIGGIKNMAQGRPESPQDIWHQCCRQAGATTVAPACRQPIGPPGRRRLWLGPCCRPLPAIPAS